MPDPVLILSALAAAFAASGVILGLIVWTWRRAGVTSSHVGCSLAVAGGFFLGCWILAIRPHWPPRDDQDRLLALVFPAVIVVEVIGAFLRPLRWLLWPLRIILLAGTVRVLLHGTSYITDLSGPGTSEWPPLTAWLIFGGLAAAAGSVWGLLALLAHRTPGPALPVSLAVVTATAAVTVMLSGYLSAGQIGLSLAAALAGATASSLLFQGSGRQWDFPGVVIVGLFCLLLVGRFFGELTTAHAIVLFCAPLLGWLPELPYVRRVPPWSRGLARVVLVAIAVSVVAVQAQRKAVQEFAPPSSGNAREPSAEDYMNFGK